MVTKANFLSCIRNPEKQEKLRQEVLSFGPGNLSPVDIGQMRYFRACLSENFRLTPTIAFLGRVIPNDIVLKGHLIPAKTFIMLSSISHGRDPKYFRDPETFRPERWLEEKDQVGHFMSWGSPGQISNSASFKFLQSSRGAVAQSVEHPSKVPVWCNSTD